MLEAPEVEAHHHKTGHSRLDIIFAALAVVLSCVSVGVALKHGKTMERLVEANTWPNISYSTGNEDDNGAPMIRLDLKNTGVGPARIDSFEVFYKGNPMADGVALVRAASPDVHGVLSLDTSPVRGEVLPARESITFFVLRPAKAPAFYDIMNKARFNIRVRTCYCSVFDECYVADTEAHRPTHVEQCEASQPVQYREATENSK